MEKYWHWEVHAGTSQKAMARTLEAVLRTRSRITSTHCLGISMGLPLGRGVACDLMVAIPEGIEEMFREIAKPYDMKAPGLLQVGRSSQADDGHPGRKRAT